VRGTPTFFINGRRLVGAQPIERFAALIDDELVRADELLRSGVARSGLYAALTAGGLEKAAAEAPPAPAGAGPCAAGNCPNHGGGNAAPDPSRDATVHKVELGGAPTRGPADAPITVVVFSDFECPFCKKVEGTIAELEKAYPGKIRIAWKNYPLPFHANARPAALLALAAHRRGKFWAMHDALLANQAGLGAADLERHAEALGLGADLRAALGSAELAAAIDADVKQAEALGVTGTPTVFLNGRRVVGAFPLATFRAIVEQELAKRGG
jgi:protein-disulfide isomerase